MLISANSKKKHDRRPKLDDEVIQEMAKVQNSGIEVGPLLAEVVRRMPEPVDGKRDTRRARARRALETLCSGDDAPYWLGDDGCVAIC